MSAGVLTLQEILNKTVLLSLSMAWQLGRAVKRAQINSSNILEAIVAQQNGTILIMGKVRVDKDDVYIPTQSLLLTLYVPQAEWVLIWAKCSLPQGDRGGPCDSGRVWKTGGCSGRFRGLQRSHGQDNGKE